MLENYFNREHTRVTYGEGPAGPYLDAFTHWLEKQGYRHDTIRHRLQGAAQFACWAKSAGLDVQALTSPTLMVINALTIPASTVFVAVCTAAMAWSCWSRSATNCLILNRDARNVTTDGPVNDSRDCSNDSTRAFKRRFNKHLETV